MSSEEIPLVLTMFIETLMIKVNNYLETDPAWGKPEMNSSPGYINIRIKHNSGNTAIITFELSDEGVGVQVSGEPKVNDASWCEPLITIVREFNAEMRACLGSRVSNDEWIRVPEGCKMFTNRHVRHQPGSPEYIHAYAGHIAHLAQVLTLLPRIQPRQWSSVELGDAKVSDRHIELKHTSGIRFRVKFNITRQGVQIELMRTVGDIEPRAYKSLIVTIETFIEEFEDYDPGNARTSQGPGSEDAKVVHAPESKADLAPTVAPIVSPRAAPTVAPRAAPTVTDLKETMDNLSNFGEFVARFTMALMTFRDHHPDYAFQTSIARTTARFIVMNADDEKFVVTVTAQRGNFSIQATDYQMPGANELGTMLKLITEEFRARDSENNNEAVSADRRARFIMSLLEKITEYISDKPAWSAPVVTTGDSEVIIGLTYTSSSGIGNAEIIAESEQLGVGLKYRYTGPDDYQEAFADLITSVR